ncbi:unnamed protein product, partial [Phaeothamnion confervicola]
CRGWHAAVFPGWHPLPFGGGSGWAHSGIAAADAAFMMQQASAMQQAAGSMPSPLPWALSTQQPLLEDPVAMPLPGQQIFGTPPLAGVAMPGPVAAGMMAGGMAPPMGATADAPFLGTPERQARPQHCPASPYFGYGFGRGGGGGAGYGSGGGAGNYGSAADRGWCSTPAAAAAAAAAAAGAAAGMGHSPAQQEVPFSTLPPALALPSPGAQITMSGCASAGLAPNAGP